MDTSHLIPLTINATQLAKGIYVVGLTPSQIHLYRYCLCHSLAKAPIYERADGFEGSMADWSTVLILVSGLSYWV